MLFFGLDTKKPTVSGLETGIKRLNGGVVSGLNQVSKRLDALYKQTRHIYNEREKKNERLYVQQTHRKERPGYIYSFPVLVLKYLSQINPNIPNVL